MIVGWVEPVSVPVVIEKGGITMRLLKVDEAARRLRVEKSWIYGRIHAGTLPFEYLKVGHYIRIPEQGVEGYLKGCLRSPTGGRFSSQNRGC